MNKQLIHIDWQVLHLKNEMFSLEWCICFCYLHRIPFFLFTSSSSTVQVTLTDVTKLNGTMFYANATVNGTLGAATGPVSSRVCFAAIDDLQLVTRVFKLKLKQQWKSSIQFVRQYVELLVKFYSVTYGVPFFFMINVFVFSVILYLRYPRL
jgi:hypothetical protein